MTTMAPPCGGPTSAGPLPFNIARDAWTAHYLCEGERVAGEVVRLPEHGAFNGTRLFVRQADGRVVAFHAAAAKGHTVLERRLRELNVAVGDRVTVGYLGKRRTADGEREYRAYEVTTDAR